MKNQEDKVELESFRREKVTGFRETKQEKHLKKASIIDCMQIHSPGWSSFNRFQYLSIDFLAQFIFGLESSSIDRYCNLLIDVSHFGLG